MEELWIIYYWYEIPINNKVNTSPSFDCICLDEEPDNDLLKKEVAKRKAEFDENNLSHKAGIICKISVRRVRYEDEPFDHLELGVYRMENQQKDYLGVVTTDMISLSKDIYQLARMGSGLVKRKCESVVINIENNFYRLKTVKESKINKPYIIESFNILMKLYKEYLKIIDDKEEKGNGKQKDGLWKNYGYDETQGQFFIPVKDFKEIYEDMDVSKEMGITEYKKLLKQNGYSIANQGRNDYTHTVYGKVIALYIKEIEKVLEENNGKP